MPTLMAPIDEAREHLRVIRQTMERSTKYSTLSGLSGVLIGCVALFGVWLTSRMTWETYIAVSAGSDAEVKRQLIAAQTAAFDTPNPHELLYLASIWTTVLLAAIAIDFLANKRRAARVGKTVVSPIGGHIILAALPGFLAGAVLTFFFYQHGLLFAIWGVWMLCYGLAICAVGLFSVKPVSALGGAFVLAGAVTLLLPNSAQLPMMAVTFGGFHIVYGVLMAWRHGW